MSVITPWLICAALCLVLGLTIYAAVKVQKRNRDEIKRLAAELTKQKQNMAYLVKHTQEIVKITQDQDEVQEEIRNAQSDEEVADIINAIININNSKLRNKAEG